METYNFNLYIGSKASIAEMHGSEMNDILLQYSCQRMGISDSMYKEGPVILIQHGTEGETEFFLSEAKLILRPLSCMTPVEVIEYRLQYEPVPNLSTSDHWWIKDLQMLRSPLQETLWLIKNGFDVGIIPEGKFILTTDLAQ